MSSTSAIGIDLGTTHSRVAVFRDGKVETIPSDHGGLSMPSTVGYTRLKSDMYVKVPGDLESFHCERVIGDEAVEQDDKDAYNRVFSIKRLMGRTFDDTVQSEAKYWPFKVCKSSVDEKPAPYREPCFYSPEYVDDGRPPKPKVKVCFNYGRRSFYYAEEIAAMLLEKIKKAAGIYLGGMPVTDAVISVPACFNDAQRQATLDAAAIAGLNVLRLINDPTAVAIQYYREKEPSGPRKVLIFDLGGGTCDVSIFVVDRHRIEVKSTAGDSHLGGDDFVNNTMESVMDEVDKIEVHKCTRKPYSYLDQIRKGCENAMHVLSKSNVDQVEVFVRHKYHAFKHTAIVTRDRFESLNRPLLNRIEALVDSALEGAGLHHSNIDDVILVGRSSNIQIIRRFFKEKFAENEPVELTNPNAAVAFGAAIMAAKLQGDPSLRDFQVFDVLSRSLSYETSNGEVKTVAKRNEPIPIRKCMPFKFRSDKKVHNLNVYEDGAGGTPESKRLLGKFELTGIIPVSTVESFTVHPEIQVYFSIDMNGVLHVSATTYGKKFQVTADKGSFRRDELDILKNYLNTWLSEEDKVKIRNWSKYSLDAFISNSVSRVSYDIDDKKSQMTTGEKEEILERCREAQKWFDENQENADTEEFKRMLRELSHFCQPIFDKYEIDQWPLYANPKTLQMERSSRAARELVQLSDQGVAVEPESATDDKQKLLCGSLEKKAGNSKRKTESSKPKTESPKPKTESPNQKTESPKPKNESPKQKTEKLKLKTESPNQKTTSKLNVGTSPQILDLETGSTSSKSKPGISKDNTVSPNKEQESPEKKSDDGVTRLKSNKIHPKRSQTQVDSSNKHII